MSTGDTDIELIERFISDKLTQTELEDFETRLEEDHEFARKFRLRKTFPSLFKAEGQDEIAMSATATPAEKPKKKKAHSLKTRYLVLGGTILLLAMALVYFLFFWRVSPDREVAGRKIIVTTVEKTKEKGNNPAPVKVAEQAQIQVKVAEQAQIPVKVAEQAKTLVKPAVNVRNSIILVSPPDNMTVKRGEEVVFTWRQATDSFTNFFIISEASNKLAWWRGIRPGIREIKVPAMNFKPGRFYWYVGTREVRRTIIIKE